MTISERLRDAVAGPLSGDESVGSAQNLEAVLIDEYLGDERVGDLLEGLALYAPRSGPPYVDAPELRRLIEEALARLQ